MLSESLVVRAEYCRLERRCFVSFRDLDAGDPVVQVWHNELGCHVRVLREYVHVDQADR